MSGDLRPPVSTGRRLLRFNSVGAIGAVIQFSALWFFVSALKINYLVATCLAVETAILHNFVWHVNWTWGDRKSRSTALQLVGRLIRFHLGNGLVSLISNLLLMRLLVGTLHLPVVPANLLSVLATAAANYLIGEFFVFR